MAEETPPAELDPAPDEGDAPERASSRDDAPALEIVRAIDDGLAVDWSQALEKTPERETVVRQLKRLEEIVSANRNDSARLTAAPGNRTQAAPDRTPTAALFEWGHLKVLEKLGEGTFGEVFRAWDPRLGREVALKLARRQAGEASRRSTRSLEEARRLARTRHPNVLAVYGADEHDGRAGIWTELLHGSTLEDRLVREGPVGAREAALIGADLCSALAAVHGVGLVHGDIKTTNIMREGVALGDPVQPAGVSATREGDGARRMEPGRIVLMDFGAARESPVAGVAPAAASYGTPLFLAPEVVGGHRPVPASDIYSLGVVLYRLVTGRYPVEGSSFTEVRATIGSGAWIPLRTCRPDLPAPFVQVVERALARSLTDRYASAAEMERALAATLGTSSAPAQPSALRRNASIALAGGVIAMVVVTGLVLSRRHPAPKPGPVEFELAFPPDTGLTMYPSNAAISPDGRMIAAVEIGKDGTPRLWLQSLDAVGTRLLPQTNDAWWPFWSPDSRSIGFFCPAEKKLKKISISGGSSVALCEAGAGRGGCWCMDNTILFAPTTEGPLLRVRADGGDAVAATALDTSRREFSHRFPMLLPDGRHYLFAALPMRRNGWDIFAGSLGSKRVKKIMAAGSMPVYAPPGYLLFERDGKLVAQGFDAAQLELKGEAVAIADAPEPTGMDAEPIASASTNGRLVYPEVRAAQTRLALLDRSGQVRGVVATLEGHYTNLAISPDGRFAAMIRTETTLRSSLWIIDLARGAATRLSPVGVQEAFPVWSPDGSQIAFSSNREAPMDIWVQGTGGSAAAELLVKTSDVFQYPGDWSPDGQWLVYSNLRPEGKDIWAFSLRERKSTPCATMSFSEENPEFSPDGTWLAYQSNESGRAEIYVQSFPAGAGKTRVSTGGGDWPRWTRGGRELIYWSGNHKSVMAVPVEKGAIVRVGQPHRLFDLPADALTYELVVSRDGERFLVYLTTGDLIPRSLRVRVGWTAALGR